MSCPRPVRWGWALVLLFLFSCEPAPARIDLNLYYPPGQEGTQVYKGVASFDIAIKGDSLKNSKGEKGQFGRDEENPLLPNIRCDKEKRKLELEVEITGYTSKDRPVAYGRQILYIPCGKERQIQIFVSPINQFATLTQFINGESRAARMTRVRAGQRVSYLPDGRVLITGGGILQGPGKFADITDKTEIFDPETGIFQNGPRMSSARAFHTSTQVLNRIVVTGGIRLNNGKLEAVRTADVFELTGDGQIRKLADTPPIQEARAFHTASITPNEKNIFLFGGQVANTDGTLTYTTRWEIIDSRGKPIGSGDIPEAQRRAFHTATELGNGRVLLAGGVRHDSNGDIKALGSMLYVEFTKTDEDVTVKEHGRLKQARLGHTATRLQDDRVLLTGGMEPDSSQKYPFDQFTPKTVFKTVDLLASDGTPGSTSLELQEARTFHTANLLEDGRIIIFGGFNGTKTVGGAEQFRPSNQTPLIRLPGLLAQRKDRFLHTGTLLLNGSLLILGGVAIDSSETDYATLYRGELFNPGPPPSK